MAEAAAQLDRERLQRRAEHAQTDIGLAEDGPRVGAQVRAGADTLGRDDGGAAGHRIGRIAAQAEGLVQADAGRLQDRDVRLLTVATGQTDIVDRALTLVEVEAAHDHVEIVNRVVELKLVRILLGINPALLDRGRLAVRREAVDHRREIEILEQRALEAAVIGDVGEREVVGEIARENAGEGIAVGQRADIDLRGEIARLHRIAAHAQRCEARDAGEGGAQVMDRARIVVLPEILARQHQIGGGRQLEFEDAAHHAALEIIDLGSGGRVGAEAVAVLGLARETEVDAFHDRSADRGFGDDGVVIAVGEAAIARKIAGGLGGDEVDRAAGGVAPVKRALRAA